MGDADETPTDELRRKIYRSKREDRIRTILTMRAAGHSCESIASAVGASSTMAIRQVLKRQRQRMRENEDPKALLDGKLAVKAVRNLERILDDKKHEANWDATKNTLYGTGLLRKHLNTNVDPTGANQLPALTVNVVTVNSKGKLPADEPRALPDITINAVGTPREI